MKTIWKFPLEVANHHQDIYVPLGAELIEVHHQPNPHLGDDIVLWFVVDTEAKYDQRRTFRVYGTGWEMDETEVIDHIGSVHVREYVWHVFEVKEGKITGKRRYMLDAPDFKELIDSGKWRPRS
jgi:hypothetical protein